MTAFVADESGINNDADVFKGFTGFEPGQAFYACTARHKPVEEDQVGQGLNAPEHFVEGYLEVRVATEEGRIGKAVEGIPENLDLFRVVIYEYPFQCVLRC